MDLGLLIEAIMALMAVIAALFGFVW